MARTKGSLNRSTIEKMREMQEFEKFKRIKEQMDSENGINRESTPIDSSVSNEPQKNYQEVKNMENTTDTNTASQTATTETTEAPKKHVGRPRKNPVPIPTNEDTDADSDAPEPPKPIKEPKVSYSRCERCHATIMCQPNKIDMDHLTNSAGYHRAFARFAILCPSCTGKLNELIDEFLWNDGQGMEPKPYSEYGMRNFRKEDDDSQNNQ